MRPMRKTFLVLLAQFALLGTVASAPVDIDADLMRGIDDTAKSLDSNVAQKDGKDAAAEARELVDTFTRIEAQDFDAAGDAVSQLTRSCKSCHDVYKKD